MDNVTRTLAVGVPWEPSKPYAPYRSLIAHAGVLVTLSMLIPTQPYALLGSNPNPPIDSAPPHFHHTVWSMCGRSVARMWPNSGHVVVTPTTLAPQTHHKGSRFCGQIVVPEPPTIGPH